MPLRPDLYRRLCQRSRQYGFGEVLIVHEGSEMQATVEQDALDGRPRLCVSWPGEYYKVHCAFCNDTRHRLWINYRWGLYDPRTDSRHLWLAHCFNEEECLNHYSKQKLLYRLIFDDIPNGRGNFNDPVNPGTRPAARMGNFRPVGEYYHLDKLPQHHHSVLYLRSRGYDTNWLGRELRVGYCPVANPEFPMASDRIIIPIWFKGQPVGWQARYIGDDVPEGLPKYFSMSGMRKTEVLYNLDVAKNYPFCVICEGCTDVWRVGPAAVALLGKSLSAIQKHLLTTTWGHGAVIVLLDGDAPVDGQRIYDALGDQVRHRVLVQLPGRNDPADFSHADLWRMIDATAQQQGVDLHALGPSPAGAIAGAHSRRD
jgi:hypothetical protein